MESVEILGYGIVYRTTGNAEEVYGLFSLYGKLEIGNTHHTSKSDG